MFQLRMVSWVWWKACRDFGKMRKHSVVKNRIIFQICCATLNKQLFLWCHCLFDLPVLWIIEMRLLSLPKKMKLIQLSYLSIFVCFCNFSAYCLKSFSPLHCLQILSLKVLHILWKLASEERRKDPHSH